MMLTQTNISQHLFKGKIAGNRDEKPGFPQHSFQLRRSASLAAKVPTTAGSDELITEANNLTVGPVGMAVFMGHRVL